jgi:hypothetical protein
MSGHRLVNDSIHDSSQFRNWILYAAAVRNRKSPPNRDFSSLLISSSQTCR